VASPPPSPPPSPPVAPPPPSQAPPKPSVPAAATADATADAEDDASPFQRAKPTYWEPLMGAPKRQLNYVTSNSTRDNVVEYTPDPRDDSAGVPLGGRGWNPFSRSKTADGWPETFEKPLIAINAGGKYDSFTDAADSVLSRDGLLGEEDEQEVEAHKLWVQLTGEKEVLVHGHNQRWKRPAGQLLISLQLVPVAEVPNLPAGAGRSAPNTHPKLPKPVGRLRFTLNPFSMIHQFLGDKLCAYLVCGLTIAVIVLLMYYMLPVLLANGITSVVSSLFNHGFIVAIAIFVGVPCLLVFCGCSLGG